MTDFIANYFHYLIVLVPFIAGFVVYEELKAAGTKIYNDKLEVIGTQIYVGARTYMVK